MASSLHQSEHGSKGKGIFLCAFLLACFLFWWLPSVLFRAVLDIEDPVNNWALFISIAASAIFIVGYSFPWPHLPVVFNFKPSTDLCEKLAYKITMVLAIPALMLAVKFSLYRSGVDYGTGENISLLYQAVLYTHLFVGLMFLGAARSDDSDRSRVFIAAALVTLPRLIISLHWGRFYLAQAVVPVIFIAIARGWVRWSAKRLLQLVAVALVIIFVPALTRGDKVFGQGEMVEFFSGGSTLRLFQDNRELDLAGRCPPILVSFTAQLVPYSLLHVCTIDVSGNRNMPASLERILTFNDPANDGLLTGPGANFLLELYVTGGTLAVIIGSALFGFSCRRFIEWIGQRSIFAGIWAECLSRALFAPRSTLGYVYERIPSLVLTSLLIAGMVWAARLLRGTSLRNASGIPRAL